MCRGTETCMNQPRGMGRPETRDEGGGKEPRKLLLG